MATIYRRADYRLEKTEKIVAPKISIHRVKRTVLNAINDDLIRIEIIYNFACKNYKLGARTGANLFCPTCQHSKECDINNKQFRDFSYKRSICRKCDKHSLSRYYIYLLWKLKDFIDPDKMECCWCRGEKE